MHIILSIFDTMSAPISFTDEKDAMILVEWAVWWLGLDLGLCLGLCFDLCLDMMLLLFFFGLRASILIGGDSGSISDSI